MQILWGVMASSKLTFATEALLVSEFLSVLQTSASPWESLSFLTEYDYSRGRPDVVAASQSNHLYAFEAKLTKWRYALHQAYRNTSFSHYSYVVLPAEIAKRALVFEYEFERRSVGLCSVTPDETKILLQAPFVEPIQPALNNWITSDILKEQ